MTIITIDSLQPGALIPFGGNRAAVITPELAARFQSGDHLLVLQETGDLLHIPADQIALAAAAVSQGHAAFQAMLAVSDEAITRFFGTFAAHLEDSLVWAVIAEANARDVERAQRAGRSTTRLVATDGMRHDMIAGLQAWRDNGTIRGHVVDRMMHRGWTLEQVAAPLGVVGFVFEGRPNVFADAAGVVRTGNTAVLRIGSDALGTAKAIMQHALVPALSEAGLPLGAISLVESPERSTGWALFADRRLSLAVARGSGRAVAQLGSVARQAGTPVSLHGTGGAWMVADRDADAERFSAAVEASLDRKVCNTLNVCCIHRARTDDLIPAFLAALEAAGRAQGHGCKLHVVAGDETALPPAWRTGTVRARRAEGDGIEPLTDILPEDQLGGEWEWEYTPEVSLKIVDDLDHAIALFNRYSPRFAASLISQRPEAHQHFFDRVDAPFVGDGFTRWVDGQYALDQPELGLSNWENGRLLARSAILSGRGIFTVRSRVAQIDPRLRR